MGVIVLRHLLLRTVNRTQNRPSHAAPKFLPTALIGQACVGKTKYYDYSVALGLKHIIVGVLNGQSTIGIEACDQSGGLSGIGQLLLCGGR